MVLKLELGYPEIHFSLQNSLLLSFRLIFLSKRTIYRIYKLAYVNNEDFPSSQVLTHITGMTHTHTSCSVDHTSDLKQISWRLML